MDGLREGSRIAMGSLPGLDPVSAVQTQLRAFPERPAWPQLPKKSPKEQMTRQGLSGLPGLSWPAPDQPVFTLSSWDLSEALEALKNENLENRLDRAAFKPDEASGFFTFLNDPGRFISSHAAAVKGQFIGPVSLGLTLQHENGTPLLASKESMKILVEYVLMHCRWQSRKLSALRKPVVFFMDEPSLNGRFQPESYGLEWSEIQGWLTGVFEALQEEGVITGLHSCGQGPWDWAFELPVEIFHFDAFRHMPQLLENPEGLRKFIHRGGMVSWGLVPTGMSRGAFPDPAELFGLWEDAFDTLLKKRFVREELIGRSHFSTSCGLGNSSLSVVEEAVRCLGTLVSLWRANISLK